MPKADIESSPRLSSHLPNTFQQYRIKARFGVSRLEVLDQELRSPLGVVDRSLRFANIAFPQTTHSAFNKIDQVLHGANEAHRPIPV